MHWIFYQLTMKRKLIQGEGQKEWPKKQMENLETIYLTIFWNDMLERINRIINVFQWKDVNVLVATNFLESMETYLQETRDKYECKARIMCLEFRERKRSVGLKRYDGSAENHFSVKPKISRWKIPSLF